MCDASTYLLVDKHGNDENEDQEDNDENNNDTNFTLGPVLLALDELVESILAPGNNEVHVDGGHCVDGFELLQS